MNAKHQSDHLAINSIRLTEIPSTINCKSKTYRIFGIVEQRGLEASGGHIVAYIKRDTYTYDDMFHHEPKKNVNKNVTAVALFYALEDSEKIASQNTATDVEARKI